MNLIKKIILCFIAIVFITITACKKYPDGPLISLTTKETRLCKVWDVAYFSINGYDSTAYLKSQVFYGTYKFERPEKGNDGWIIYSALDRNYAGGGSWFFINNKKSVGVRCSSYSGFTGNIGPYRAYYVIWDIMRLGENELWLKTIYNGKEYFVKFK